MPRTFDIRFARATGFAAILEAPANSFRWRGAASLRIDDSGLEIEPKRSLQTLLARRARLRINTADLREVSRAADALRIEFGMPGARRAVVPFWVKDLDTAAEIMRLVPTDRTIERDEPMAKAATARRRHSPFALVLVGLGSLMIGVIGTSIVKSWHYTAGSSTRSDESSRAAAEPSPLPPLAADTRAARSPGTAPTPVVGESAYRPTVGVSPAEADLEEKDAGSRTRPESAFPAGDAASVEVAASVDAGGESDIRWFMREALALRSDHVYGNTPPDVLEIRWWALSERLYNSPTFDSRPRNVLVDRELGLSLNWRASLANYAEASRSGNRERIEAARADLQTADELTDEVNRLLD